MSFTAGTSTGGFGTAAKPTAFGAPLTFGTPATTASTGFGGFGTSFGTAQTQQQTPAFGSTFGAPATSAPAFGSTFGATASTAPAFGSTFGSTTPAPAFGSTFGAPAATTPAFGTSFGTPASTAPSLFGTCTTKPNLFGSTTTPSLFSAPAVSAPLFGATSTTQSTSLFGTGTSGAPSLFGGTTTPSMFGSSFGQTTTTPSLFGNTATTGGFSLLGNTTTTTSAPLFGGFGSNTGTTFGGFGTGTSSFGIKPTTQQPQGPELKNQQLLASFYAVNVYGDERDDILKKWNMLQACWGTGKGFYSGNQPPVEYDHCNPYFRFTAIGYSKLPDKDNTEGYVKLTFQKKESELSNQQSVIINGLNSILGNKPNLTVTIIHIKAISETASEVVITVTEKGVTGSNRKILATDLASFLNQPQQKQSLTSAGVSSVLAYVTPTKTEIEEYLKEPPPGIDQQMWNAAQFDNPNPAKFLPVAYIGFDSLKRRMLSLQQETSLHEGFISKVDSEISELRKKHTSYLSELSEQKQKLLQLQHRVLKILVKQEMTRKVGLPLQPEEEVLRARLERIQTSLKVPLQYRGKINELLTTAKFISKDPYTKGESYKLEPNVQDEIKDFLTMQQSGITQLMNIINNDLKDLKVITDSIPPSK